MERCSSLRVRPRACLSGSGRIRNVRNCLCVAPVILAGCLSLQAQNARERSPIRDELGLQHALSAAPREADGGGGSGHDETFGSDTAELAKELQNPVADLITVPIQNNWDFGIGPADAMRYTANIQPVIPVTLNKDWNLITRTIVPVIYAESPVIGGRNAWGLGDIVQSFFLSPKEPVGGWIVGGGPVFLWPTATDSLLGLGRWGAGPTVVALQQQKGWTYGILANHIWSYAGWGNREVSATFLQPFITYTTKTYTTFGANTESTYDWENRQWTVPLNGFVSQLLKIGKQPIQFTVGGRYYADKPKGGPDWGLRFTITLLFPK
jgi:hypothetical protein